MPRRAPRLEFDPADLAALAEPLTLLETDAKTLVAPNRIAYQPMEANDAGREAQYTFEESCCQALYNASAPRDPFDPSSAFFVAPWAFGLARVVGVPIEAVVGALERR